MKPWDEQCVAFWTPEAPQTRMPPDQMRRASDPSLVEPPAFGKYDAVRFWTVDGKAVIYEYRDGKRMLNTTYAKYNELGRPYYQKGDVVLLGKNKKRWVARVFPELQSAEQSFSPLWLAMTLLGWEEPEYKYGYRIASLSHDGKGGGSAELQGILFIDDTPVPLQAMSSWTRQMLNDSFVYSRLAEDLQFTQAVLRVAAEIEIILLTGPLSGVRKAIGKRLLKEAGRQAIRMGLRKVFFSLLRISANAFAKATAAFLISVAKDLCTYSDKRAMAERAKAPGAAELTPVIRQAIVTAAGEFATTLIREALEGPLLAKVEEGMKASLPVEPRLRDRLKVFIAKEVVKIHTTEFFSTLVDVITKSWAESMDATGKLDQAKFGQALLDKLKDKVTGMIADRSKEWGSALAEEFLGEMIG